MRYEIDILRFLLRSSQRRTPLTLDGLVEGVGVEPISVRRALASLARSELVQRTAEGPRLSLAGLAVALSLPRPSRAKQVSRPRASAAMKRRRAA